MVLIQREKYLPYNPDPSVYCRVCDSYFNDIVAYEKHLVEERGTLVEVVGKAIKDMIEVKK